jgi:hypothetical protein
LDLGTNSFSASPTFKNRASTVTRGDAHLVIPFYTRMVTSMRLKIDQFEYSIILFDPV